MKRTPVLLLLLAACTGGPPPIPSDARCWRPGETIPGSVAVESADGKAVTLAEIVASAPAARAVVLYIMGGAEGPREAPGSPKRGGIWCEDTFNDLSIARHLVKRYEGGEALFIGIVCPPVYHEKRLGYDEGAFLKAGPDDPVYRENRRHLIERTLALRENGLIPFERLYFDPRLRLLSNPNKGEASGAAGPRPPWQGRFKWHEDVQSYGVPTIWVLTRDLRVTGPPFFMNVYETKGETLRYSALDVCARIDATIGP